MTIGRPSSYKPEYAVQAKKLCERGFTDKELADFFEVSEQTINSWKQNPAFLEALKAGKEPADERVERSLFHRAIGYTFDSEKIQVLRDGEVVRVPTREHVPPDTTACIFWLKNRRPDLWRDVHKHEHGGPGDFDRLEDDALLAELKREAAELGISPKLLNGKGNGTAH